MKKTFKQAILLLLILVLLCGCGAQTSTDETLPSDTATDDSQETTSSPTDHQDTTIQTETVVSLTYDWTAGTSPIPDVRVGILENALGMTSNGFECTSSGAYFHADGLSAGYILYVDHGSDAVVILCNRPDCTHDSYQCNAVIAEGVSVNYYDGHLYAVLGGTTLIRMDLDGSNRERLVSASGIDLGTPQVGYTAPLVAGGCYFVGLDHLDSEGRTVSEIYYYKLDGSMEAMEKCTGALLFNNDGEEYIFNQLNGIAVWDPDTNEVTMKTEFLGYGYYGAEEAYYIDQGIVYRLTYDTGEKEVLLDTGLEGGHYLHCFPDFFVISNFPTEEELFSGTFPEQQILRFYNWNFESIGEVELTYPGATDVTKTICGETPERIYLMDSYYCVPRYYINKADLGTGDIQIHELELPDVVTAWYDNSNQGTPE